MRVHRYSEWRYHLTIDLRCRTWVAGRQAVFKEIQVCVEKLLQPTATLRLVRLIKTFEPWTASLLQGVLDLCSPNDRGYIPNYKGYYCDHGYIKLYSSITPAVAPGMTMDSPRPICHNLPMYPQAIGRSHRHFAKDSLYLMTTALKGSALILTWACVLERSTSCPISPATVGCWSMYSCPFFKSKDVSFVYPELAEGKLEKGTLHIVMYYPGWLRPYIWWLKTHGRK